jgi:hypothetical protein
MSIACDRMHISSTPHAERTSRRARAAVERARWSPAVPCCTVSGDARVLCVWCAIAHNAPNQSFLYKFYLNVLATTRGIEAVDPRERLVMGVM